MPAVLDSAATESALPLLDALIEQGVEAVSVIADEIRRKVRARARRTTSTAILLREARRIIARHEPLLARTVSDTLLAAWMTGADRALRRLPPPAFSPPPPPGNLVGGDPGDPGPLVRFPIIEESARALLSRQVMTRPAFDALAQGARASGFTVARVGSLDALEKLRGALAENVATGGTMREFRASVNDVLGRSALSPAHIENVYRTNAAAAYTQGLMEALEHPLVSDEFPYLAYYAVHDSRTRENHRALEKHGIGGSSVYRRDDPIWEKFLPPWDYQCRCNVVPLTLEDAARKGIREAKAWLRTSAPPLNPTYVRPPPFEPPEGWARRGRFEPII